MIILETLSSFFCDAEHMVWIILTLQKSEKIFFLIGRHHSGLFVYFRLEDFKQKKNKTKTGPATELKISNFHKNLKRPLL